MILTLDHVENELKNYSYFFTLSEFIKYCSFFLLYVHKVLLLDFLHQKFLSYLLIEIKTIFFFEFTSKNKIFFLGHLFVVNLLYKKIRLGKNFF